jgi:hypothetical protein
VVNVSKIKKLIWFLGPIFLFVWFGFKTVVYTIDVLDIEGPLICYYTDVS